VRRVITFVLIGLGVFALALGLLLRFYAYPNLAKAPLNPDSLSVGQGSGITALVFVKNGSADTPEIRRNLNLTSTTTVTGDFTQPEVKDGTDVASWIEAAIVRADGEPDLQPVDGSVRQLCVDRFSGEAVVPCESQYIQEGDYDDRVIGTRDELQQPGLSFKLPFDAEKKTYKWYDLTAKGAYDLVFEAEDTVKGLDVYRYSYEVPPTKIDERQVPGTLVGSTEPTVDADLYYQVKKTIWADPVTGAVVAGEQTGRQELRQAGEGAGQGTSVFEGTLRLNDDTVDRFVKAAEDNRSKLWLLTTLPVILWIVGPLLIILGVALLLLGRRDEDRADSDRRQPALARSDG